MRLLDRLKKHIRRLAIRAGWLLAIPACILRLVGYIRGGRFSLILSHSWGGGSESFLRAELLPTRGSVLVVRGGGVSVELEAYRAGRLLWRCRVLSFSGLLWLLFLVVSKGALSAVYVNHLVEFKRLDSILRHILSLRRKSSKCELVYFMHDHYALCPSMFLLNSESRFCGVPAQDVCDGCARAQGVRFRAGANMHQWRNIWKEFLSACDKVVCFSNASKEIVLKGHGEDMALKIQIVPHEIHAALAKPFSIPCRGGNVRVGILGNLSHHKGLGFVANLANCAQDAGWNVDFVVIGSALEEIFHPNIKVYGAYVLERLPLLARFLGVDFFLIPSIVPETFSYATAEVMAMGYPLVVFDLGAPGERVGNYCYGKVLPYELADDASAALKEMLAWYQGNVAAQARRLNAELSAYELRDVADAYLGF